MLVGRKTQSGKAGITEAAQIERRHRVAAEPEEAERTALEAIRHFLATAAKLDEIIAIARGLEDFELCIGRSAGELIAGGIV